MNAPAPWMELSAAAAMLVAGMLLVMWAQDTSSRCARPLDAPRQLVLSRETDREHLANDLASANRIARRYAASKADAESPDSRFLGCHATLLGDIANAHGMPLDQLTAADRSSASK